MTRAAKIWQEHQRERFMRPDAHLYVRPDATRFMRPQADRSPPLAVVDAQQDFPQIEAERQQLLAAKALAAELKFYLALQRFARKYRPDQPRDDHGRWVDDPAGNENQDEAEDDSATDFSAASKLPRIPEQRPPDSRVRTAIATLVANWIGENGIPAAEAVAKTSWLYSALPNIISYLDPPKSLQELQESAVLPRQVMIGTMS
jgi:hypothetical protein